MLSFDNLLRNINTFNLFILSCCVYDKSLGRTSDSFPHSMKKPEIYLFHCFPPCSTSREVCQLLENLLRKMLSWCILYSLWYYI